MIRKIFPSNFLQVFLFLCISFLCIVGVFYFDQIFLENYTLDKRMAFEGFFFLFIPILLFLLINFNKKKLLKFNVKKININKLYIIILFILLLVYINYILNIYIYKENIIFNPYSYGNLWMLISTCLLGPILEEIYFRIIIQNGIEQSYSSKYAILITAILFMLVHEPKQYILSLIIGIIIGYTYNFFKCNIIVPIILHLIVNNFSTLLKYISYRNEITSPILISLSIIILCIIIYKILKNVNNRKNIFNRS